MHWESIMFVNSCYCPIHFIDMVWNSTHNISEVHLCHAVTDQVQGLEGEPFSRTLS